MYKVFSSGLNAKPLVVEPCGAFGYKEAVSVSITLFVGKSITDTELSFALATNKYLPFFEIQKSLGWLPVAIVPVNVLLMVLNTYNLSQPQQVMYNSVLSGDS